MPTSPLPEGPGRTAAPVGTAGTEATPRVQQYVARDAAFNSYIAENLSMANTAERQFAKTVFNAGWDARKRATLLGSAGD